MKIRNLSKLALAVAISSSVVFEGCKKYDDDITRLEESIKGNASDIATLKSQLASLAANNVVKSVTSIDGGFRIVFTNAQGAETSYEVINGEKGEKGEKGDEGKPGVQWRISADGYWESSTDGQTWKKSEVKAVGTSGDSAEAPEIKEVDGKHYWFINGENTGIQANSGDITLVKVSGGYQVVLTSSDGTETEPIFLATEAVAVNNLTLVPKYTKGNTQVVFFPRIVDNEDDRNTVLQGNGVFTYNLNPFGVAIANFDAEGLLVQNTDEVQFRASEEEETPSPNFKLSTSEKTFGDITVRFTPVGDVNKWFPKAGAGQDLHVALQVRNHKSNADQQLVSSAFTLAKEEIVEQDEITIERSVRDKNAEGDKVTLLTGVTPNFSAGAFIDAPATSLAHTLASAESKAEADFSLHIKNNAERNIDNNANFKGGIVLDDQLNGFFARTQVGNQIVSMDDHGLENYNLQYDIDHYNQGADELNWIKLDKNSGKIEVKISTTNTDTYNTAAVNNFAVVRVRAFAGTDNKTEIAERFIKVNFVQSAAQEITVEGTVNHQVVGSPSVDQKITWKTPSTLDAAYNKTGKTAEDFHAVYDFVPDADLEEGFTISRAVMEAGQGSERFVTIANTVLPGTYTLKGQYVSSQSTDPIVNVKINVVVKGDLITNLTKNAPFWDKDLKYGIVNGKQTGSSWELQADLWDLFNESEVEGDDLPVTTYEFTIIDPEKYDDGITVATGTSELVLDETVDKARAMVNNGNVTLQVTRKVNGKPYNITTFSPKFDVQFINPVKAIEVKKPYKEFKDKEVSGTNISTVDARQLVTLKDFNNVTLFDFNGTGAPNNVYKADLIGYYGIENLASNFSITGINFVRAEDASGKTTTLPASTRAFVDGNNLSWENLGANLQQPIYLVYTVTVTNKFNQGDVTKTKSEVVKEVKVKVNPNL